MVIFSLIFHIVSTLYRIHTENYIYKKKKYYTLNQLYGGKIKKK